MSEISLESMIPKDMKEAFEHKFCNLLFRCEKCKQIPFLETCSVNEQEFSIIKRCKCMKDPEKINQAEFLKNLKKNSIYNFDKCAICGKKNEIEKNNQSVFYYCLDMNDEKIICHKCHDEKQISEQKRAVDIKNFDRTCLLHNLFYTSYCRDCQIDLCNNCFSLHKGHTIINLNDLSENIKIDDFENDIKIFKKNIEIMNNIKEEIIKSFEEKVKKCEEVINVYKKNITNLEFQKYSIANFYILQKQNNLNYKMFYNLEIHKFKFICQKFNIESFQNTNEFSKLQKIINFCNYVNKQNFIQFKEKPDWVVSPFGNDEGSGKLDSPFKTLSKAVSTTKNGETICIMPGEYNLEPETSIDYPNYSQVGVTDKGKQLTIYGCNSETKLIFDGKKSNFRDACAIQLSNPNSVFRNLVYEFFPAKVNNYSNAIIYFSKGTIRNVYFNVIGNSAGSFCYDNNGNKNRVENCTFKFENYASSYSSGTIYEGLLSNYIPQGGNFTISSKVVKKFNNIEDTIIDDEVNKEKAGVYHGKYSWDKYYG